MRLLTMAMMTGGVVLAGSTVGVDHVIAQTGSPDEAEARYALELAQSGLASVGPAMGLVGPALAEARAALGSVRMGMTGQSAEMAAARAELAQARAERGAMRAERVTMRTRRDTRVEAPEAWLQEDPGTPIYREARESLNRRRYADAAEQFAELRDEFPRSGYVADSYYWEAFSRFREGGARQLREAAELLSIQADEHPDASTRRDADALMVRIEAQLARRGDADAAAAIAETASGPCDEQQEVRLAALSALLNMNAEQAVPILREVLESRDECSVELRRRAVFLISQKMTDESVDILLDLAHRNPDPDPEVREQAIFWLHQVDSPEALDALESILLESEDPEIQERAIFAISQRSGDARAIAILKSYAERSDIPNELRGTAIFWISQNADAGGAEYLIELYPRLDDEELKERAIFGISQAGGPQARAWLLERVRDTREDVEIRKNALFWVGQMGGVRAADLQGLYDTLSDIEMKEQVIFVASQTGETEAVDFLMDVARTEDDQELKERAIFWLGQSNDPRVPEFLLSLIRGGTVRR
jgi:HEAT repeat protein